MYRNYKLTSELAKTPFNRISSYNLELARKTAEELGITTRFLIRFLLEKEEIIVGRIKLENSNTYKYEIGLGFFLLLNKVRAKRGLAKLELTSDNEMAIRYA